MLPADRLRKDWETRVRTASIEPAPNIAEAGLVLGAGTVLARRITDRHGRSTFAIDGNEGRILALLAVAYGRAVEPEIIFHLRRASAEPRILAGNGIESGEWTEDYGSVSRRSRCGGERRHKNTGPEIPTNSSTPSIRRFTNSLNGSTSTKPGCWASPRMKAGISIRTIARSTIRSALLTVAVRMCTMTR